MLSSKIKKEALAAHKKALDEYNEAIVDAQYRCEELYNSRQESIEAIDKIESLINSIANTPKEFEHILSRVYIERGKFRETEQYAAEAYNELLKSGIGTIAGVAGGATFASLAPTGAMWIATTFGTASTGTAISTLTGAAATNAALAWLGGGAVAIGGGGMAAGNALLLLAGPVGWGIAAGAITSSMVVLNNKNKKLAKKAFEETDKLIIAYYGLIETGKSISQLYNETVLILENIDSQFSNAKKMENSDYSKLTSKKQTLLGTLANNTMSLAEMLNKTVEQPEETK